ncbi:MAG TPA: inositol monophosphatase family protein [Planctomycetaceae bacterium]|nr:inositol monophosphatase family protein [Planctomycetaceae bacterium]
MRVVELNTLVSALRLHVPPVVRWAGAVAKRLRQFDIRLDGQKLSGSPSTDALTLADLTVQELLVAALRDGPPVFRQCRLEAEESTGDLARFAADAPYTIALDPIDGTRAYRDHTGTGWAVLVNLRSAETVHYSLVFIPEQDEHGAWVEAFDDRILCGPDDPSRPAVDVLRSLSPIDPAARPDSKKIYLIGFQQADAEKARALAAAGLEGYTADELPGCIFDLFARGEFGGSLIHTPNVYDFPISLHLARLLGGDAVWVHDSRPADFRELWLDDRADMLRMPGIIAASHNRRTLDALCRLARDWNPARYAD